MSIADTVFALIQDRLGQALRGVLDGNTRPEHIFQIKPGDGSLAAQLIDPSRPAPNATFRLALDVVGAAAGLPRPGGPQDDPEQLVGTFLRGEALGGRLPVLGGLSDQISSLLGSDNPMRVRDARQAVLARIIEALSGSGASDGHRAMLQGVVGDDVATVLSLATVVNAIGNVAGIPEAMTAGLYEYFFRKEGFKTADGAGVVAPEHGALAMEQLKGVFPQATAERYIRDITRVLVESAYDQGRDMKSRFTRASQAGAWQPPGKFVEWFRGVSSFSESTAMRGVEVVGQGVSQFQTNPLIAAAAGSLAGTLARKVAQDSFLGLLDTRF